MSSVCLLPRSRDVNEARADDDWWGRDRKRAGERLSCQSRRSDPHGQVRTSVPEESAASVTGAPLLGNHHTTLFSHYFNNNIIIISYVIVLWLKRYSISL